MAERPHTQVLSLVALCAKGHEFTTDWFDVNFYSSGSEPGPSVMELTCPICDHYEEIVV